MDGPDITQNKRYNWECPRPRCEPPLDIAVENIHKTTHRYTLVLGANIKSNPHRNVKNHIFLAWGRYTRAMGCSPHVVHCNIYKRHVNGAFLDTIQKSWMWLRPFKGPF